ncbi:MAG: hypothetical protein LBI28_06340 [Treponema sp.]|jgi:hypothetical protein|nr:hypothetical protein [Treponema sp.]
MKIAKQALAALSVIVVLMALIGCASKPKVTIVELENKGSLTNVRTPDWVTTYVQYGVSRVQAQSAFRDRYCIIGEETGVNLQFVTAWADNFSAQQRIGAMIRTTIASEYQARVQGQAQSSGGASSARAEGGNSGAYSQEIESIINALITASYSGAQRESDWWSLRRRYDPDNKDVYSDQYTAYVLYTIPKAEMNRQIAMALETSVSSDSALYQVTIDIARQIMQNGVANWGAE